MRKTAWILKDFRDGNTTQTTSLAESLGLDYEIKNIEYNCFAKLPNWLLRGLLHIDKKKSTSLDGLAPDVIISAGRRCAVVAAYLKKRENGRVKIINIMRPLSYFDAFDYIILPDHDKTEPAKNIIFITGALNAARIKIQTAQDLKALYPELADFVGIVIGGKTRFFEFSQGDNQNFVDLLKRFLQETKLIPVITFSRRTPLSTKELIKKAFAGHIIYDPQEDAGPNIYYNILKSAKYIICTGDSVSMCSEAASSGKPSYIYLPHDIKRSAKHGRFIKQLIDKKIARILDNSSNIEEYTYEPLNEGERIAKLIKL